MKRSNWQSLACQLNQEEEEQQLCLFCANIWKVIKWVETHDFISFYSSFTISKSQN